MGCGAGIVSISAEELAARIQKHVPDASCGVRTEWIKSKADGLYLFCAIWPANLTSPPNKLVIYIHGSALHCLDDVKDEILKPLADEAYTVWAFDWRGHGRTGKVADNFGPNCVGTLEQRQDDLETIFDAACEIHPKLPVFLMGHSWGGLQGIIFMLRNVQHERIQHLKGFIALAPGYGDKKLSKATLAVLSCLPNHVTLRRTKTGASMTKDAGDIGLTVETVSQFVHEANSDGNGFLDEGELRTVLNDKMRLHLSDQDIAESITYYDTNGDGKLSVEEFIADVACEERHAGDEYNFEYLSTTFVNQATSDGKMLEKMMPAAHEVSTPYLWIHGEADRVNSIEAMQPVFEAFQSSDRTRSRFATLRHGIYLDKDVAQVRRAIIEWLHCH